MNWKEEFNKLATRTECERTGVAYVELPFGPSSQEQSSNIAEPSDRQLTKCKCAKHSERTAQKVIEADGEMQRN